MKAIRQVLRYVKGTEDYGITYMHNGGNKIHGYNDSSYGVNTQEGKGTTGIIFYYATAAATQALWLKRLLSKLTHSEEYKVTIRVDNKSAITLMKNPSDFETGKMNPSSFSSSKGKRDPSYDGTEQSNYKRHHTMIPVSHDICYEVLKSIEDSKMCVVVFFHNYASSVPSRKISKLLRLMMKSIPERVDMWKKALRDACKLAGSTLHINR
nr:ribonuclease H-like domain, reverse transcriptase, RNA-dependent DNA polymerase [Tanacetum cinerariifolium]